MNIRIDTRLSGEGMSSNTGNLGLDLRGVLPNASVIALTTRAGLRRPIRELVEGLYLYVEGGEIVTRPAGGGSLEGPSLLIPPPDSYAGSAGSNPTLYSQEGHSHLLNISPTAFPLANGVASIGNGYTYADIYHTHPEPPPAVPPPPALSTATLYTAYVRNPLYRDDCKCHLKTGYGTGFLSSEWTNFTGTSTWVHNVPGKIVGWLVGGVDTIPLVAGDRIFVDGDSAILGGPDPYIGIYEVMAPGDPAESVYAVIRRVLDATTPSGLCHGMAVKVVNGLYGPPDYPVITTADPIVVDTTDITLSDIGTWGTPPYTDKYEALTGPQLTSEGASNSYFDMAATGMGGVGGTFVETEFPRRFITLAGTPGVTSLATGMYVFDVESVGVSAVPPGTVAFLRAKLIDIDNGEAVILTADSPPVTAGGSRPISMTFFNTLSSAYSFAPDRRLQVRYYLWTNTTSPVTLGMSYSSVSHGTKITLPFAMGVSGAVDGVHGHLSGRSDPNQHPATAVATDTTNFNHNLSSADTTVQHALDTLDDLTGFSLTKYPGPMTVVGTDFAGTSGQYADGNHSHPVNPAPPPSSLASSTLYTAYVEDSQLRVPCKCHLAFASGYGWNASQWTPTYGTSTWRQIATGPILGCTFGGGTTPLFAGDRVYIAYDAATSGGPSAYLGIYEVLDPGSLTTQAVIRRALDANTPAGLCNSMTVEVPTIGGPSDWPVIVTPDPIVVDTTLLTLSSSSGWSTPPTLTQKWELLTGPQITTEGASTGVFQQNVTGTGLGVGIGFNETVMPQIFDSLVSVPGVEALAAGPYVMDVEGVAASPTADPGATVYLLVKMYDADSGSLILVMTSPPVTAVGSRPENLSFTVILSSPYTWTPGHRLRLKFFLWTDSASPVLLGITYNSPSRGTKLTVPFTIPVSGASDGVHDHLSGRNTVNNHYGVGTCTTVAGVIPTPTQRSMVVTVSGTTTLTEMGMTGLEDGVDIDLLFLQACHILNNTTPATGNACFIFDTMVDGTPNDIDWTQPTPRSYGRFGVKLYKTQLPASPCFLLTKGPII